MIARFDGRCQLCQEPICEGDPIQLVENEYCHEECVVEYAEGGGLVQWA